MKPIPPLYIGARLGRVPAQRKLTTLLEGKAALPASQKVGITVSLQMPSGLVAAQ